LKKKFEVVEESKGNAIEFNLPQDYNMDKKNNEEEEEEEEEKKKKKKKLMIMIMIMIMILSITKMHQEVTTEVPLLN